MISVDEFKNTFGREPVAGDQVTVGDQTYTMGKDSFEQSDSGTSATNKSDTPPTWDGPEDARKLPGAGKYPNFYVHKTRSGHTLIMDDSKGAEHVTLQHRGGSMIQLQPDGKMYISAQNGQYNIVFGENRMKITGAYDIAVDGAASLRVNKDYNVTVAGDINMTATKNFNLTAQNFNQTIRGNIDVAAKNLTEKLEGSLMTSVKGAMSQVSKGAYMAGSIDNGASLFANESIAINADKGQLMVRSGTKMSFTSMTDDIAIMTLTGKFSVTAMQAVIVGEAAATIESAGWAQLLGGISATVESPTGLVGLTGQRVSALGVTAGVAIAAAGPISLSSAMGVGIAATLAVSLKANAIGLNAPMVASTGIIQQNGTIVDVPAPGIPFTPPIPGIPGIPSNPKTDFRVTPADTTTAEIPSDTTEYSYA